MARPPAKGTPPVTRTPASTATSTRPPVSVRTGRAAAAKEAAAKDAAASKDGSKDTARRPTLHPPPDRRVEPDAAAGPPPPKGALDEVERALSALDGRHHDAARAQRETQLSIAARRAAQEEAERQALAADKRATVLKVVFGLLAVGLLSGGGWYGNMRYRRTLAADAALAPLAQPFVAAGWKAFARPLWKPRDRTEVSVGANTCVLALASANPGNGHLVLDRPSGTLKADGSLAYCACKDEPIVLHTDGDPLGGVQLLYQDAVSLGGNSALAFVSPRPAALPIAETCAVDPLDAWLAAGHGVSAPNADALAPAARAPLEAAAWKLVASAPAGVPFAVVPGAADSCFVGLSSTPGEALSLREVGGGRPFHPAAGASLAIAWCTHAAQPVTVWRAGTGTIAVYRTPAGPLGGTLGLRERSPALGLGDLPVWVAPTERAWDASAPLYMSGIPTADITIPGDSRPVLHSRVVSLTIGSGHITPVPDELDRYLCTPSLEQNPPSALCVQSLALGWKPTGPEVVGIAESPLPFWMDVMSQVEDRHGLEVEQKLLSLSRRLAAQRFEATARAGVAEEKDGVEVMGQSGDDRVVAIGILSTPPWVLPYTDGVPWTLDGEPHSIDIGEGEDIHLTVKPWANVPPEVRRTVVFRHRK